MSGSAIRIVILVDNAAGDGLAPEHGFSAWIEAGGRRTLFDTGQGAALERNASRLGVSLRAADHLVLSHGHYDHTGGVAHVLAQAPEVQVHLHETATAPRYSIREGVARSIGMPEAARIALERLPSERVHRIARPVELPGGLGIAGPIPRTSAFEDVGGPFFLDAAAHRPDSIPDDLALWLRTERGLVVLVGCCHAGLVNTLALVRELSGEPRIHAVLGGLHLREAGGARLDATVAALEALEVELLVPCHCSGDGAVARLQGALGDRVRPGASGQAFTFRAAATEAGLPAGG
jgi:7,8-dihydropterin-6-yl-methyl-4-(beta-D-ribofuranosyl)aminobenzene 5'-phosphate synthase